MGKPVRVSVVLCTYRGERFLGEQLTSLLAQTRRPDEIIVSDDASGDGTEALLEQFAASARANGIAVEVAIQPINIGFVANFSAALRRASGEVVFLCDQDDVWYPEKVAMMMAEFDRRPDLLLLHADARLVDTHLNNLHCSLFEALVLSEPEVALIHDGRAFDVLLRRSAATGATMALRRELVDAALPVPPGWIHDEWLALAASILGRVDLLEVPVIDYRQHNNNQIGMRPRTLRDKWEDLVRPRTPLMIAEVKRMEQLTEWLSSQPAIVASYLNRVRARTAHFSARLQIGQRSRMFRFPAIFREWRLGRYKLFSNDMRSIIRDALRRG